MPQPTKRRYSKKTIVAVLIAAGALAMQFVRPGIEAPPANGELEVPPEVKVIIVKGCYDCHSNKANLRWYDQVAPAYWLVAGHIKDGRKALNFSQWQNLTVPEQNAKLWECVNQVISGDMPLPGYTAVHGSAKISPRELQVLKSYVTSLAPHIHVDSAKTHDADTQLQQWYKDSAGVQQAPVAANGVAFIPDYKNWQAVSTTERFDNGTMRVILGNDVAIQALHSNVRPWPDGTVFAKVAWDQLNDRDSSIHTGAFKQVEFMIKDAKKYAGTKGWGWARFRTMKLVPYGKDALFTTECVNCHRPVKDNDFVFTLPVKH
ncbi:heme-binding domain-containing protein [Deminuibacter soli]|uniref:Cytochrome P460 n=1 Tax=Deminuibacter soli TaxID=2291815 RepID=A0A3E1NHP4_9BACT|nr:heme-binding domain-containing protein [Deminuibacter soli]RFM27470.1 cytochrome P460 [Deminuibacter soli]